MQYDEYDWGFNEEANKPSVWEYNRAHMRWPDTRKFISNFYGDCIGENCCDEGMVYSSDKQKCLEPQSVETYNAST